MYTDEMRSRLKLDDAQAARLGQILDATDQRFRAFRESHKPEMDAIHEEQVRDVNAMLNESQRSAYEEFRKETSRQQGEKQQPGHGRVGYRVSDSVSVSERPRDGTSASVGCSAQRASKRFSTPESANAADGRHVPRNAATAKPSVGRSPAKPPATWVWGIAQRASAPPANAPRRRRGGAAGEGDERREPEGRRSQRGAAEKPRHGRHGVGRETLAGRGGRTVPSGSVRGRRRGGRRAHDGRRRATCGRTSGTRL